MKCSIGTFQNQMKMIKQMGSLREVMSKLPFMDEIMGQLPAEALDDRELTKVEAMIDSMTKQERVKPDLLDDSRMKRIARGCGRPLQDVKDLKERFQMTRLMMRDVGVATGMTGTKAEQRRIREQMAKMSQAGMGRMPGMSGLDAVVGPNVPQISSAEIDARRKKEKAARKARKKNR